MGRSLGNLKPRSKLINPHAILSQFTGSGQPKAATMLFFSAFLVLVASAVDLCQGRAPVVPTVCPNWAISCPMVSATDGWIWDGRWTQRPSQFAALMPRSNP